MIKVFVNGNQGTTGLKIFDRLNNRSDIELLTVDESLRKDTLACAKIMDEADIAFLCLPDAAAVEAVSSVSNPNLKIIDTSTAHRTLSGWAYGFAELSKAHRSAIKTSKRIAVPGCHASGFISLVYPLTQSGIMGNDYPVTCHSLTGYSGGGKKMIADYRSEGRDIALSSARQYGISQMHKHLPEMQKICSLDYAPIFCPIVDD
ncbi:MAG: N-acetyl-gamma-glutamyl-phosphate reductase, partial [Clostridia bacterium]|nr:N-acetyl-gamma-glutamyl-phosphate reductase [Clostridia bacterium]